jgi:signal transduction histidine kinase
MVASLVDIDRVKRQLRAGRVDDARNTLDLARDVLAAATERTRKLTFELRPQLLEAAGLRPAINELTHQLSDQTGADVTLTAAPRRYPPRVEAIAYRTIREALINIRSHAHATRVSVNIVEDGGTLHVEIRDDGCGFDASPSSDLSDHFGVQIAREQIEAAGGAFQITSHPGQGTSVSFDLPLTQ